MLAPVRTTAPATIPVSLAEAKAHLRVDFADDDALIAALVAAATEHCDGWSGVLGRCLVSQGWAQAYPRWGARLRLPLPALAVTAVAYVDPAGGAQTLNPAAWRLLRDAGGSFVLLDEALAWPALDDRPDAVTVSFTAGYGDAAAVPAPIKAAILLLVGHWYANREAVGAPAADLPMGVTALLAPYRLSTV